MFLTSEPVILSLVWFVNRWHW